jgi:hypothetical protein
MKKLALAALAALLATGCVIDGDDDHIHRGEIGGPGTPTRTRSDLTFFISYDGASCAEAPEVDRVRLRLEGPAVADEEFLCPPGGRTFDDIPHGDYTWRIDALDADGTVLFHGTDLVRLTRDTTVTAQLRPVGEPPVEEVGVLTFFWTFGGLNCADAGVAEVRVTLPGQFDEPVPCATDGVEGVAIENVLAGATSWTLTGTDAGGATVLFQATGTATVPANGEVQVTADLQPVGEGG